MNNRSESPVRLKDIAARVGLSNITVSKALRDHADISPETRERIKQVAAEMGYVPNHFARSLQSRGGSRLLGVVLPKIRHAFFAETFAAIQEEAAERGYEILMGVSQEDPEVERRHMETFVSMRVEGLLLSVTQRPGSPAAYDQVRKQGVPLVLFDRTPQMDTGFPAVLMADAVGARDAVGLAAAQGRRRIAHLAGYGDVNIGRDRRAGYEAGLVDAGLPLRPEWIIEGGFDELAGYRGLERLWSAAERPDAIFCASFPVAVGAMDALRAIAPQAVGQILFVFFGVREMARFFPHPYVCIVQPAAEMGRTAVEQVIRAINRQPLAPQAPLALQLLDSSQPVEPGYLVSLRAAPTPSDD